MNEESELPKYVDCKSKIKISCDFYMHKNCKETCAYAIDIGGLGIGAGDTIGIGKKLNKENLKE